MNRETLRTLLISLIAIATAIGLNQFVPILNFLIGNIDSVWASVTVIGSFFAGLWMYITRKKTS